MGLHLSYNCRHATVAARFRALVVLAVLQLAEQKTAARSLQSRDLKGEDGSNRDIL